METDTPFFLWGAGISNAPPNPGKIFHVSKRNTLPLYDLEQAQLAPLMSALLGLPPPMNNFGILPIQFVNASDEYKAHAAFSNALQLLEQFKKLAVEHQKGILAPILRQFDKLNLQSVAKYERKANTDLLSGKYTIVLNRSYEIMSDALEGIDYYNRYYQNGLLLSTSIACIGWIYYLLQLLLQSANTGIDRMHAQTFWPRSKLLYIIAAIIIGFILLQRVPLITGIYFMFPILVWSLVLREQQTLFFKPKVAHFIEIALLFCCIELLVFTFFDRRFISIAFLVLTLVNNFNLSRSRDIRFYVWIMLATTLLVIPILPSPLGYQNIYLHLLGICLTFIRSQFTKWRIHWKMKIPPLIALVNALICAYQQEHQIGISIISQCISWCFLLYTFIILFYYQSFVLKHRVEFIFFHLSTLYTLFCTSYESIFLMLITSELLFSLQQNLPVPKLDVISNVAQFRIAIRFAFTILLYTLFSFFGVGNIASISSFDPNIIRCFLTTFSPFMIMSTAGATAAVAPAALALPLRRTGGGRVRAVLGLRGPDAAALSAAGLLFDTPLFRLAVPRARPAAACPALTVTPRFAVQGLLF